MNINLLRLTTSGLIVVGTTLGITAIDAVSPVALLNPTSLGQPSTHRALAQNTEDSINVRVYQVANPAVVSIDAGNGTGSGSIISPDGLILTNAHVVRNVQTVKVTLADGRQFDGDVVAFGESGVDLAAIRLRGQTNLPFVRIARPESVAVGQRAFAIGNPFGRFQGTFTTGIVSRIDTTQGLIQTDAAINPGNSGGPLLNNQAELIGVNSAIFAPRGAAGNIGIGFAIAIDRVQSFLTAVREGRAPRTAQSPIPLNNRPAQPITLNTPPVQGQLGRSSNVLPADSSFFNAYTFEGRAGQAIQIDLNSSEFDAYLIILRPDGTDLAQDDDSGGGTNARLVVTLPENGRYTVLANSYGPGETGNYNLRVANATAGSPPRQAATPTPRPAPGRTAPSPTPRPSTGRIILQEQGILGPESQVLRSDGSLYQEHSFEGRAGQPITISLESSDFDTYLILVDPDGNKIDENDDKCNQQTPECLNSQIMITLPMTGTYRLIANAFDASGRGRYTITVRQ